eukprot:755603_1
MMLALSIANLLPIYRLGTKHVWIAKACVKPAKFSIYVGALAETQVSIQQQNDAIQQQNDALSDAQVSIQKQNDALAETQVSIQKQNDAIAEAQVSIQQQNDAMSSLLEATDKGNDATFMHMMQHQNGDFIEVLTLGSVDNSYYGESIDIEQTPFNTMFRFNRFNIIKRECLACFDAFKVIYYRRFTQLSSFDVYGSMKLWTSTNNELGTDFGLYSTLQDALSDMNRWVSCNYDAVNVGAFLDCYPDSDTGWTGCQFTADLFTWD